ncbi:MAG: DUF3825 domain-containing protein [Coriobacteriaceae bacterium]|nr:DUF3825 domain-containing protein [Coriobacteriaceae bacterium]
MAIPTKLFDFAFCMIDSKTDPSRNKSFNDYINDLASIAAPENWGPDNAILRNYVNYLFKKVSEDLNDNGIARDSLLFEKGFACMNTGLYTANYEDIFMLFEKNKVKNARQDWFLQGFFKSSAVQLQSISELPDRPRIYDNPSELIYDNRLPIRVNKDHILTDQNNVSRLPVELQDPSKKLMLHRVFEGAVKEAERRAAANYTVAVPQYYRGGIQLLLPLCLTSEEPELALAIKRYDTYYSARTCLTLEMAYSNARLVVKPEASWIVPAQ